jgi:prevent-host-death family protein
VRTVNIEEARAKLGDVVARAQLAGEPTTILRYKTPAAVVVSVEWYEQAAECLNRHREGEAR